MIRVTKTKTKGKRYAARVHVGDGKYKLLDARSTRAAAKKDEAEWLLRKEGQQNKTGREWADFYLEGYAERVKSSSLAHAESAIGCWRKTFGSRTLSTIDPTESEEWARANRWAVPPIVTMMNAAERARVVDRNTFAGLTRKGPGRKHMAPLTVHEVQRLAVIAEDAHGLGAFVTFTAYTGMRVGEVFALQWDDIDFERNRVSVKRRLYRSNIDLPKSGKTREIVLLPEARDALLGMDRSTDWVFEGKRGGRLSQSKVTYYWQKIEGDFGRKVNRHELRHFCGHHLYRTLGYRADVVAAQLTHSSPRLVEDLYGHGDVGALEEIERTYSERSNVVPLRRTSNG